MKKTLKYTLPTVALLLILEAAARLLVHTQLIHLPPTSTDQWYQLTPDTGWEPRPGFTGVVYGTATSFTDGGLTPQDAAKVQSHAKPIILLVGDSCTFGYGVPTNANFGAQLENTLTNYSVVNLGVPGYTSEQGLTRLAKFLPIAKPALIIVAFNYNDRRYVLPPRQPDNASQWRHDYLAEKINTTVSRYSTLAALLTAANTNQLNPQNIGQIRFDQLQARVPPESYRSNLTAIAQLAGHAQTPIIFLALPDNPRDQRPLLMGCDYLHDGLLEPAIKHLQGAVALSNVFSTLAQGYLAQALTASGATNEATTASILQKISYSQHGGRPIYLASEYHTLMQAIAKEQGVQLVDATAQLSALPQIFVDGCHFNTQGHTIVAQILAKAIVVEGCAPRVPPTLARYKLRNSQCIPTSESKLTTAIRQAATSKTAAKESAPTETQEPGLENTPTNRATFPPQTDNCPNKQSNRADQQPNNQAR